MMSLNKLLNTNKKIYLSGNTFEEQYNFNNGFDQIKTFLEYNTNNNNLKMEDLKLIIYKKTVVGISIEFDLSIFLITPILSSIKTQFLFINLLNSFKLSKYSLDYISIINIRQFMGSIIMHLSITNYEEYKNINIINKNMFSSIYSKNRVLKILETLNKINFVLKNNSNFSCFTFGSRTIEICCGYGLSTLGLKLNNITPLSLDWNQEDIMLGIFFNFLNPELTINLDVSKIANYFSNKQFDSCFGFMIGTIYKFNENIWKKIIYESIKIIKKKGLLILTVRTLEEVQLIQKWISHLMKFHIIIDNRDKFTEYDQWVYLALKK